MLASAAGDALGWPQENRGGRVGGQRGIEAKLDFVDWRRRDGGRYASHEEVIRAGEYSDDTQLVLAVARALLAGNDWWERWTRVDLPFWLQYERGGGSATKTAARSWMGGTPPWRGDERRRYFASGGNGVAMRVMPHCVRYSSTADFSPIARSALADGIATHGHPRALVGALAYAYVLWRALRREEHLGYGELIDQARQGVSEWGALLASERIPDDWRILADEQFDSDYGRVWDNTVAEMLSLLRVCAEGAEQAALSIDREILDRLGCFDPKISGSGTVTAAGAIFLASRYASRPTQGLVAAAFASGADCDTLAAMTGALLGAVNGPDWLGRAAEVLQDHGYLVHMTDALLAKTAPAVVQPTASMATFWRELAGITVGTRLDLPDGRIGTVRDIVEHPTRTRNRIRTWIVDASDGQTVFLKKITRPHEQRERPTEQAQQPLVDRQGHRAIVAVEAADIERSVVFYRDVMGLEIRKRRHDYVQFGGFALVPSIATSRAANPVSQLRLSEDLFAAKTKIVVFVERTEIEPLREHLIDAKVVVSPVRERDERRYFCCLDPDGTVIELREANGGLTGQG